MQSVHDTHVWSLDGEFHVLTTHVVIGENVTIDEALEVKCRIKNLIHEATIPHATVEIERSNESCELTEC